MTVTPLAGETGNEERPLRALWFDLETTGSHRTDDHVLEIGCRIAEADYPYQEIAGPWRWVVRPAGDEWTCRMIPVVVEMHVANGLLAAVFTNEAVPLETAEGELIAKLGHLKLRPHELVMAGSGVAHFDKGVVDAQMPKLARWLRYWTFDVGNVRRFLRSCGYARVVEECREKVLPNDKAHRSVDDVDAHMAEARFYAQWLREVGASAGQPPAS